MTTSNTPFKTSLTDFDYELPPDRIAQEPLADRASSRLMLLDRQTGERSDHHFSDITQFLRRGDLLVVNDSRVIPARIQGQRSTGGAVEFLLLRPDIDGRWLALAKPSRKLKVDESIEIQARNGEPPAYVTVREKREEGQVLIDLDAELSAHLDRYGHMPLPPYITHQLEDESRYQTVYALPEGSAAAPTAGLHFTRELMAEIRALGVDIAPVTLHVGLDTFRPVVEEYAEDHHIHSEWCTVSDATWQALERTRANGGRVIAVGTTSARTLETLGQRMRAGKPGPFDAFTEIYITPGYQWTMVDALITNFHLPKSTLLMMISAFAGREQVLAAYQEAIEKGYRFFSFGDAMFIR